MFIPYYDIERPDPVVIYNSFSMLANLFISTCLTSCTESFINGIHRMPILFDVWFTGFKYLIKLISVCVDG